MNKSNTSFLIVNLGLRSNRVIVFDGAGNKLAEETEQVETHVPADQVEQDPSEWWSLTETLVMNIDPQVRESIGYVTVTSSSCNLVCTDASGEPVYGSLLVSDKRSKPQAERIASDDRFKACLSHDNFSASASYMFPKISWIAENEPAVFEATDTFGSSNSFLTERFTDNSVTDYLDAEKFYYHRDTGYPDVFLNHLGLDDKRFPDVVRVGTDIGPITNEVAIKLGLSSKARFVVTTYDALAAFWGSGPTAEGDGSNVCGTCSSLRTAMPGTADLNLSGSTIKAQRFERPDILAVGGSNSLEGGLLEWVKSTLYSDREQEEVLFDEMEADAKSSPLGANGLVFMPYLLGERAPFDDPDARGAFFGLERKHAREDLVRAVFESIGFLTRHMVTEIERSGATVDRLRTAGGLTQRELACQIKADVTGKPVVLIEELENTALGCMVIVASRAWEEDMQEVAGDVVDTTHRFEPDPERHEKYSELYDLFRDLYESNKKFFKRRAEITRRLDEDDTKSHQQL